MRGDGFLKKTFAVIGVLFLLIVAGVYFYYNNGLTTLNSNDVEYEIKKGQSASSVVDELVAGGIIKNKLIYKIHLKLENETSHFKAGTYTIQPYTTLVLLNGQFNKGDSSKEENIQFTILEGWTTEEALVEIEGKTGVSQASLLDYAKTTELDYWFLAGVEKDDHMLDGVLYPDTYLVKKDPTAKDVLSKVLSNLDRKLTPLKSQFETSSLSTNEILTAASLIEKEARHDRDRPKIAQIIYNRLSEDMLLQIDATVLAVVGHKQLVTYEDLKVDSPYNTYKYKGLPPTPIAMPSMASIEASLNPEAHDYLFYVADRDTGYHHFAKTFQEHKENIEKYWKK